MNPRIPFSVPVKILSGTDGAAVATGASVGVFFPAPVESGPVDDIPII